MNRPEFSAARKQAALERAAGPDGKPRCQDPQCGISAEWHAQVWKPLAAIELRVPVRAGLMATLCVPRAGAGETELITLRDAILAERFRFPRVLNPIIKQFRLAGGALLEVDHELECADGGGNQLDNAIVRCVFCHYFKTQVRANARRRAPKKAPPDLAAAQTSVLTEAQLAPLREKIAEKLAGPREGERLETGRRVIPPTQKHPTPEPGKPRRHFSETQWAARMAEKARALEDTDGFWGA